MGEHEGAFFKATGDVPISAKDLLSWIFEKPSPYPDEKPIYIDADNPTEALSRPQCRSIIRRLIAGLKAMSLQRGDCVCVHAFGNIYYSCIFLAVVGAGLVWTGTNPGYTRYELEHHLKKARAKLIISESALLDDILTVAKSCKIRPEHVLDLDLIDRPRPPVPTFRSWRFLMDYGEADWDTFDSLAMAKSTPACRLFSSGTTGLPKAASLSHHNLIAQHTLLHEQIPRPYDISRILCLPFFHAAMVPIGHVTPLRGGHTSYIMRRFQLEDFLRYTEQYKVSEIFVVPPIIVSLLQSALIQKYSLSSLRWGMIGGAALNLVAQKTFTGLMNANGRINCCYGMTELSCIAATYPWPEEDDEGSIGYFLPNLEVKLVDDAHQEIRAYDTTGEIWIRGPTVIDGYFDDPTATKLSFTGDWFHTGDLGYCAAKTKKWFIVGRKKELIKVRGFQVAPSELEAVLMSHPLIADAAVIGVPAPTEAEGELPRAYIVCKDNREGERLAEKDVHEHMAEHLAKYKQLRGGVVFLDNIPKTASGKYLKRKLLDLYQKQGDSASRL
ncbi:hypothetical protein BJY01DRAFT_239193 [Aspergillus pseudoustus]|uniref:AMP-binding enzyme n=1 Tax=Aspergillus pseudoustus TaxID=1810923 RepID=A0ABR4J2W7_9EURO